MWAKHKQTGFTIVELLIVIVVIGILAAISVVAYSGALERGRAAAITSDVKQLDKAFKLLMVNEGRSTWWVDTDFNGTGNPQISSVVADSNLKIYFQRLSQATEDATSAVRYDNDGDTYTGCSAAATGGVNIYFYDISQSLAQRVDTAIDDGNLDCGAVTFGAPNLRYNISRTQPI